jgi:hypothetical protein
MIAIRTALLTLLAGLLMMGCADAQQQAQPPVPPGAQVAPLEGSNEAEVRQIVTDLREALRPEYGAVEVRHYALASGETWFDVASFYESALGDSWAPDPGVAEQRLGYRLRVWRRNGSKRDAIAIGFVEPMGALSAPMLILATPE